MLRSTHKAPNQSSALPPLSLGWTEHKAPTGHTYYYNASTKQSTYTRPVVSVAITSAPPALGVDLPSSVTVADSFLQYQSVAAPGWSNHHPLNQSQSLESRGGHNAHGDQRGGRNPQQNRKPQPVDKPKSKHPIPGCEPWILVHTKLGRRFVYHPEKNKSYWRIPDKLKDGILALDQQRIKEKADALAESTRHEAQRSVGAEARPTASELQVPEVPGNQEDDSEYEEVEVTDDEDAADHGEERAQLSNMDTAQEEEAVEFNEDDIAFQLAAMGQEYGLEPDEYGNGEAEDGDEDPDAYQLTMEDASALFKDLLNDSGISPYSPWDKIIEDGKLVDDTRYIALTSMKARKEVWEEWSRDKMKQLREQRAKEEKKDPRIPYLEFLHKHATPKLYWPEFKRKFRKEPELRDPALSDKDREKWYREHINRLKLPPSTLKSDFLALLRGQPLSTLNNSTLSSHLPPAVLADVRYISLDPEVREPLIEAFIVNLPSAPPVVGDDEDEGARKERAERDRRQKALEERERHVNEEKRRQHRNLEIGKGRLRQEEEDIARAMNVTKKGLWDHLMDVDDTRKA